MNRLWKGLGVAALVLSVFVASGTALEIAGLQEQPVDVSYNNDFITFNTSYLDKNVSYKDVLIPSNFTDNLKKWQVKSKSTSGDVTELQIQYEFDTNTGYDSLNGYKFDSKITFNGSGIESVKSSEAAFNVSVSSHYEHLIVDYRHNYTDGSGNYTVDSWKNVYSGAEPERIAVSDGLTSHLHWKNNGVHELEINYDNLYDGEKEVTVGVVYENGADIEKVNGPEVENLDSWNYSELQHRADNADLSVSPPDLKSGFSISWYNVTVPSDSIQDVTARVSNANGKQVDMYLLGSVAGASSVLQGQPEVNRADWNKIKNLSVQDFGGGSVSKAQPIYIVNGTDATTGNGNITVNWDENNIDGKEDFVITNSTGYVFPYEFSSFDLTQQKAQIWIYSNWTFDGSEQAQLVYGNSSDGTNYENVSGTWDNTGQNTEAVYHLNDLDDDPNTQDSVLDSSPFDRNGTANGQGDAGGPINRSGQFSSAGSFDGSNDRIFTDTDGDGSVNSFTQSSGPVSVVVWAETSVDRGAADGLITFKEGGSNTDAGWSVYRSGSGGEFRVTWRTSDGSSQNGIDSSNIGQGSFSGLGFTHAPSDGSSEIYIDGSLDNSGTTPSLADTTADYRIGQRQNSDNYFEGGLDEVRVYSEVKKTEFWKADFNASRKGGQTFFNQSTGSKVNSAPKLSNNVSWDVGVELNTTINIDDFGENDIKSRNNIPSGTVTEFTNSTLIVQDIISPFNWFASIKDFFGNDGTREVNVTTFDDGYRQSIESPQNTSTQYINRSVTVWNRGNKSNLSVTFDDLGAVVTDGTVDTSVGSGTNTSTTEVWKGDFIINEKTGNESFDFGQSLPVTGSYTGVHEFKAENTESPTLNISRNPAYSSPSDCQDTNNTYVSIPGNGIGREPVSLSCSVGALKNFDNKFEDGKPSTDFDRYWWNGTISIDNDRTDGTKLTWSVKKNKLNEWEQRVSGSEDAVVNGTKDNLFVDTNSSYVIVTIPTNFSTSSLPAGNFDAGLTWYAEDSGGGSQLPSPKVFSVRQEIDGNVQAERLRFTGRSGFQKVSGQSFLIQNDVQDRYNVSFTALSGEGCRFLTDLTGRPRVVQANTGGDTVTTTIRFDIAHGYRFQPGTYSCIIAVQQEPDGYLETREATIVLERDIVGRFMATVTQTVTTVQVPSTLSLSEAASEEPVSVPVKLYHVIAFLVVVGFVYQWRYR